MGFGLFSLGRYLVLFFAHGRKQRDEEAQSQPHADTPGQEASQQFWGLMSWEIPGALGMTFCIPKHTMCCRETAFWDTQKAQGHTDFCGFSTFHLVRNRPYGGNNKLLSKKLQNVSRMTKMPKLLSSPSCPLKKTTILLEKTALVNESQSEPSADGQNPAPVHRWLVP